jgi:hypothetical protein
MAMMRNNGQLNGDNCFVREGVERVGEKKEVKKGIVLGE